MQNKPIKYVLDTSALLALRGDERGADEVERILKEAEKGECEVYVSIADSWIIATAWQKEAMLIHKDPEYEQVKEIVELLPLPCKQMGSGVRI